MSGDVNPNHRCEKTASVEKVSWGFNAVLEGNFL
jgi:hypothetical protein